MGYLVGHVYRTLNALQCSVETEVRRWSEREEYVVPRWPRSLRRAHLVPLGLPSQLQKLISGMYLGMHYSTGAGCLVLLWGSTLMGCVKFCFVTTLGSGTSKKVP